MYGERTGDLALIHLIWPNILAALRWLDAYGDRDGDGFLEYRRETESGLANQGWKDSHDLIFHADDSFAQGPIALCEAQAYMFGAKLGAAAHQDLRRLPKLFCGFSRKPHRGPTAYPVACAPQAGASATPFALLQAPRA